MTMKESSHAHLPRKAPDDRESRAGTPIPECRLHRLEWTNYAGGLYKLPRRISFHITIGFEKL